MKTKPAANFYDRLLDALEKRLHRRPKQQEIADYVGVGQTTVSSWRRGVLPEHPRVVKLARWAGVPVDYLLTGIHAEPAHNDRIIAACVEMLERMSAAERIEVLHTLAARFESRTGAVSVDELLERIDNVVKFDPKRRN